MKRGARRTRVAPAGRVIHVIGDSHTSVFTGLHGVCGTHREYCDHAVPGFRVWHLGQYLAHSVGSARHKVHGRVRDCLREVGRGERVAFFFGEIDCRNHVVRRAPSDAEIDVVAGAVAAAYVKKCRALARGREIAFIALPPPTVTQHGNMHLPTVGTFEQRRRAVRAFNSALHAHARGAEVIDVHEALTLPNGEPNPAYFADGVHADPRSLPHFLREFVRIGWLGRTSPACVAAEALSHVAPSVAGREMLPGRLDDARAARRVLIERAALLCKAHGATRIAIWGAGRHTRAMGIGPFQSVGVEVVVIIDDATGDARETLFGVPVVPARRVPRGIRAVVLSSDAHEAALRERADAHFGGTGVCVVPIYNWQS